MSLDIRIDHDIEKVIDQFKSLKKNAIPKATRRALNKTLDKSRTRMNQEFREKRKIKIGELRKQFQRVNRAKGNRITRMVAEVIPSIKAVSLIRFVVGKKEPRRQAGISVRRRRLIRTEVRPGKKLKRAHLFIARGRGGKFQVFQRMGSKRAPIGKRSVPSFARLYLRTGMGRTLNAFASKVWPVEWGRAVQLELDKGFNKKGK
jgi:hypothetical protein